VIFVGGVPRSCTSAIMMCLKNSGFYIGNEGSLHGHKYKSEYQPLGLTLQWLLSEKKTLNKDEWVILNNVATYTVKSGVEAIKVFNFCYVLQILKDHPICKKAKYIIMSRDIDEAVISANRIDSKKFNSNKVFNQLSRTWDFGTRGLPRIKITHNDVIHNTGDVKKKLSNFLGRSIDMSIISSKETYEVSGSVH